MVQRTNSKPKERQLEPEREGKNGTPAFYGKYYWCIKVTEDICPDKEIYVMANKVVVQDGTLICLGYPDDYAKESINLAIAPGKWVAFFPASIMDGSAVAVEHWKGEVTRGRGED